MDKFKIGDLVYWDRSTKNTKYQIIATKEKSHLFNDGSGFVGIPEPGSDYLLKEYNADSGYKPFVSAMECNLKTGAETSGH